MKDLDVTRRDVLLSLLAAGTLPAVASLVRVAPAFGFTDSAGAGRSYIFCYFRGGWDLLLSLDPRGPGAALQRTASGHYFGPALAPLLPHAHRMAVVRGLSMGTLTHEGGRARFLTGRSAYRRRRGASSGTELLARSGSEVRVGEDLETPEARGAAAVDVVTSGSSRLALVELASGLDTHGAEHSTVQGPAQERGFRVMARMVDDLADRPHSSSGESWLEHTVIVGFSELGRSPSLNEWGGRDHGPSNACVLLGAGIRGGMVAGASAKQSLEPLPVDLTTGQPDPAGVLLRPEHVLQALLDDMGAPEGLGVRPLRAVLAHA